MLHRRPGVAVTYLVFDVLAVEGYSTMALPFRERRALLEELDVTGPAWQTPPVFEDGEALWTVVVDRGARGRGREAARDLPAGRTGWVGEDEEPRLLAARARCRGDPVSARATGQAARVGLGRKLEVGAADDHVLKTDVIVGSAPVYVQGEVAFAECADRDGHEALRLGTAASHSGSELVQDQTDAASCRVQVPS